MYHGEETIYSNGCSGLIKEVKVVLLVPILADPIMSVRYTVSYVDKPRCSAGESSHIANVTDAGGLSSAHPFGICC